MIRSASAEVRLAHPAVRHNGGDTLLGELFRAAAAPPAADDERVKVNADIEAETAEAPRRGYREPGRWERTPRRRKRAIWVFRTSGLLKGLYAAGLAGDVGCGVRAREHRPVRCG